MPAKTFRERVEAAIDSVYGPWDSRRDGADNVRAIKKAIKDAVLALCEDGGRWYPQGFAAQIRRLLERSGVASHIAVDRLMLDSIATMIEESERREDGGYCTCNGGFAGADDTCWVCHKPSRAHLSEKVGELDSGTPLYRHPSTGGARDSEAPNRSELLREVVALRDTLDDVGSLVRDALRGDRRPPSPEPAK